jgi:hypothetical protein
MVVKEVERDPRITDLRNDLDIQLYAASVRANAGDLSQARDVCKDLRAKLPLWRPTSSPIYAKLVRMTAITLPSKDNAEMAVELARDSADRDYHLATSGLVLASSYEVAREYKAARDVAEELSLELQHHSSSWWHSIQQRALLGRSTVLSEGSSCGPQAFRTALVELVRAQYAAAFLDFVGIPVPNPLTASGEPDLTVLTPTAIIHQFCETNPRSKSREEMKETMREIRYEAIFERSARRQPFETWALGFQSPILDTLDSRDPAPVALAPGAAGVRVRENVSRGWGHGRGAPAGA